MKKIKILLVEDSQTAQAALKKILIQQPDFEIVGMAKDGVEGFSMFQSFTPDIVCTDLVMPNMNGLDLTKKIMATAPKPVLVISDAVGKGDEANVFSLLEAGALDVIQKPRGEDFSSMSDELIKKIRVLSGVVVFSKKGVGPVPQKTESSSLKNSPIEIVVIGASTGGPPALNEILAEIPSNFSKPIVIVQHITVGFTGGLIDWLNDICSLKVQFANEGEKPTKGNIYFPQENVHLGIDSSGKFKYDNSPPYKGHRPAVNETFVSFGKHYKNQMLAVLLTGMGDDGANGMKVCRDNGAYTIAQDEASSVVYGMPRVAKELGAAMEVLSLREIVKKIHSLG